MTDTRWLDMEGGYRTSFDPRPLLKQLESNENLDETWHKLWDELHHQGDVGLASFASVPSIVRIYSAHGRLSWNPYALVTVIELARKQGNNPDVPEWLENDYFGAIHELAILGISEIQHAEDRETVRSILSILALDKGLRTHAKCLINYSEDELFEMTSQV